jgi:hypothetical protein
MATTEKELRSAKCVPVKSCPLGAHLTKWPNLSSSSCPPVSLALVAQQTNRADVALGSSLLQRSQDCCQRQASERAVVQASERRSIQIAS